MLASMSETPVEVRTMQSRILIADDQADVLRDLCLLLKGHGYSTETATSPSHFHEQEHEIAEARAIQEGFLPKEIEQLAGYEIASAWQSARVVGGDYFDVLPFDGETFGLCIADVAGKGLPAALLMSNLQAAVRGLASPSLAPEELCARLNALLCRNMATDPFFTLFYAQPDRPRPRPPYLPPR